MSDSSAVGAGRPVGRGGSLAAPEGTSVGSTVGAGCCSGLGSIASFAASALGGLGALQGGWRSDSFFSSFRAVATIIRAACRLMSPGRGIATSMARSYATRVSSPWASNP